MDIEQIFFHLTYAFLLISAITKLTPFTRFLQILAVISLGSFLTLSTKAGYVWQVWSSSVILIHLFFWKNYKSVSSKYEEYELDIWNEFFHDLTEDDFQTLLDYSKWQRIRFSGEIISDKDYFVLNYTDELKTWRLLSYSQSYSVRKGALKLFVDREELRSANTFLEEEVLHLLTGDVRTDRAS